MIDVALWVSVQRLLGREARALDACDWDNWLDLYAPDAEFWVPAWDDEGRPTSDPHTDISLIYYRNRGGLEDRVFRIRTGKSAASQPTRTCHLVQLLEITRNTETVRAKTSWNVLSYRTEQVRQLFGWAEYELAPSSDSWVIQRKKTVVLNDRIDVAVDVYDI